MNETCPKNHLNANDDDGIHHDLQFLRAWSTFIMTSTADISITKRGPRVLLGVTGSVAAVKAPEIAVRLVTECNAQVKVLLSAGGSNFWEKAKDYDSSSRESLQALLSSGNSERKIEIHSKSIHR